MTVFRGSEAIKAFLDECDSWLSESVTVYLLGGSAMTVQGLKDQTEDIDLALGVVAEFEHVCQTLTAQGFTVVDEPTESFEGVGRTVELHHDERGFQIDLFERHIEDMRTYAQRGLDYAVILTEIDEQRPFNTGTTEARQFRDRSHPLFAIEMAVNSLSGLPATFTSRVEEFATGFEVEYTVLGAVDDGINDVEAIRERVVSNVRALSEDKKDAVDNAIDRLVAKQILEHDGDMIRLR